MPQKIRSFSLLLLLQSTLLFGAERTIFLEGWKFSHVPKYAPSMLFGDEPILGRHLCPPLTRLDLSKKSSQGIVLNKAHILNNTTWVLSLRTGIYWWDQQEVTSTHLREFLQSHLKRIITYKLGSHFNIPTFKLHSQGLDVLVNWTHPPEFGPFVLNGVSIYRKGTTLPYQCAGVYKPEGQKLVANMGYKTTRPSLKLGKAENLKQPYIRFQNAHDLVVNPQNIGKKLQCNGKMNMPIFSSIFWHKNSKLTLEQRKAISQGIAKHHLQSVVSAGLSTVPATLFPTNHPGLDTLLKTQSIPKHTSKTYQSLKTTLQTVKSQHLTLLTLNKKQDLLEKFLFDNLKLLGIHLEFTQDKKHPQIDGALASVFLSWPELNYLELTQSETKELGIPLILSAELQPLIKSYLQKLSFNELDLKLLKQIQQVMYKEELITPILQHQVCVITNLTKKVYTSHPDWLKRLVSSSR